MNTVLEQRIADAEMAQAEVEAQEALRARAAALPALLERKRALEWAESAEAGAGQVQAQAEQTLDRAKPAINAWREEFVALVARLEQMVTELPAIQKDVYTALKEVQRAESLRQRASNLRSSGTVTREEEKFPELNLKLGFEVWQRLGGTDPSLSPIPNPGGPRDLQVYQPILQVVSKGPFTLYRPHSSRRLFNG